eukprot:1149734-Pelagomonas_calceolata.AAC.3
MQSVCRQGLHAMRTLGQACISIAIRPAFVIDAHASHLVVQHFGLLRGIWGSMSNPGQKRRDIWTGLAHPQSEHPQKQ